MSCLNLRHKDRGDADHRLESTLRPSCSPVHWLSPGACLNLPVTGLGLSGWPLDYFRLRSNRVNTANTMARKLAFHASWRVLISAVSAVSAMLTVRAQGRTRLGFFIWTVVPPVLYLDRLPGCAVCRPNPAGSCLLSRSTCWVVDPYG